MVVRTAILMGFKYEGYVMQGLHLQAGKRTVVLGNGGLV